MPRPKNLRKTQCTVTSAAVEQGYNPVVSWSGDFIWLQIRFDWAGEADNRAIIGRMIRPTQLHSLTIEQKRHAVTCTPRTVTATLRSPGLAGPAWLSSGFTCLSCRPAGHVFDSGALSQQDHLQHSGSHMFLSAFRKRDFGRFLLIGHAASRR